MLSTVREHRSTKRGRVPCSEELMIVGRRQKSPQKKESGQVPTPPKEKRLSTRKPSRKEIAPEETKEEESNMKAPRSHRTKKNYHDRRKGKSIREKKRSNGDESRSERKNSGEQEEPQCSPMRKAELRGSSNRTAHQKKLGVRSSAAEEKNLIFALRDCWKKVGC